MHRCLSGLALQFYSTGFEALITDTPQYLFEVPSSQQHSHAVFTYDWISTNVQASKLQYDRPTKYQAHCISGDFSTVQEQTGSLKIIWFNDFSPLSLIHSSNQPINEVLPVAMVTTLLVVSRLLSVATSCTCQFKWPQKVIGFFEVRSCNQREGEGTLERSHCIQLNGRHSV